MIPGQSLLEERGEVTNSRNLTLKDLQSVSHGVEPYLGSRDFLACLRKMGQVVIISDTFHELSEPLIAWK